MAKINDNYLKLKAGYLFPEIGRRVREFSAANPQARIIRLGIGDVTQPLPPAIIKAFHDAVDDLATSERFAGYGPEQGYEWLANAVIEKSYNKLGVQLKASELFISDGSKCDCANILDIFGMDNVIAIGDPVYPVYNDTSDAPFTVLPAITVAAPNGGEVWQQGSTQTLRWNYTGNPGSTVKIAALRSGAFLATIASSYPIGSDGEGSFNLTFPTYTPLGSDYQIRVTSTSYPACSDASDTTFEIVPP